MTKTFLLAVLVAGLAVAPAQAETTIGADVNSASNYTGACNGGGGPTGTPANRPCTVVNLTTSPARTMQAPCNGTVTRYRLNGIVTANTYRIRAVTNNGNGTYAPTATSSPPVSIQTAGVNEYPSSMPIKQGQYVGIDFMNDIVGGLNGYSGGPGSGVFEAVLYAFPADGGTGTDTPSPDYDNYLYNADIACSVAAPTTTKCKKKAKKKSASAAKKKKCKKKHHH